MKYLILFLILIILSLSGNAQTLTDCSECSKKLITKSDVESLDYNSLYMLRNEIYARKGYIFSLDYLSNYFQQFDWYKPVLDNRKVKFTDIESQNIDFIGLSLMNEVNKIGDLNNSPARPLSDSEVTSFFPEEKTNIMDFSLSIFKTYKYADKAGEYLWVLRERPYKLVNNEKKSFNNVIKATKYRIVEDTINNHLVELNSISDKIKEQDDAFLYANEVDISFWPKYTYIEDLDGDGLLEQVITTGTTKRFGYNDNMICIYIFYQNAKIKIQIYNCSVESGLFIMVDKGFYSLPARIRDNIILQMDGMLIDGVCFYPKDWKSKMSQGLVNIK